MGRPLNCETEGKSPMNRFRRFPTGLWRGLGVVTLVASVLVDFWRIVWQ